MAYAKARRGRPRGTGIDDSARLERLAELLRQHPGLKPTTAIRRLGFTDPSVIRRLRDKYKLFCKVQPADTPSTSTQPEPTRRIRLRTSDHQEAALQPEAH